MIEELLWELWDTILYYNKVTFILELTSHKRLSSIGRYTRTDFSNVTVVLAALGLDPYNQPKNRLEINQLEQVLYSNGVIKIQ